MTRTSSSSKADSDAIAATWASELTPKGIAALRSASATGSCATAYPTRSPARPYALEKVRSTATLGRSRKNAIAAGASSLVTNSR